MLQPTVFALMLTKMESEKTLRRNKQNKTRYELFHPPHLLYELQVETKT